MIADIMRALNPFTGGFYRETLQMSRMTREMFCLMEGHHVHPSTLYPGGVGTVPTVQLFTDYMVRLMKYVEFMKKVVPLHDDLFDFFYEALPGYEKVGQRRRINVCCMVDSDRVAEELRGQGFTNVRSFPAIGFEAWADSL
jgi:hydrogenase large subunit